MENTDVIFELYSLAKLSCHFVWLYRSLW